MCTFPQTHSKRKMKGECHLTVAYGRAQKPLKPGSTQNKTKQLRNPTLQVVPRNMKKVNRKGKTKTKRFGAEIWEGDERSRFRFAESDDSLNGPDPFTELPFL